MTRRETNNFLQVFPPDLQAWLIEAAKRDGVKPETIVKERIRELAEHEKAARACA